MSSIEQQAKGGKQGDIRYLTPLDIETKKEKKYCRFCKKEMDYIDYKDPEFLLFLVNEQGKIFPKRLMGTCTKHQKRVAQAIKRSRHLGLMPFEGDLIK
ncbi:MAG: 30S ribosomal protein S18 [Flavobacteriaceae bacterium]|nr:30S ribosomal protein S18 [Flavobacteriaceae bacterium]